MGSKTSELDTFSVAIAPHLNTKREGKQEKCSA